MKSYSIPFKSSILSAHWANTALQILLGTLYIILLSQVKIPLKPVPVTMQTFAIFTLALFQGSKKGALSSAIYLILATLGLPVFPSLVSDPLWLFDPSAGYMLSFPLSAYIVGKMCEFKSSSSPTWMFLGLLAAQMLTYTIGASWLSMYVGIEQAILFGIYPFILFDGVKILAAFATKMTLKRF